MTFKRATLRYGETPEPVTPYQKAAQVWDERIGLCPCPGTQLAAALLLWVGRAASTVPYVVEVDPKGGARAVEAYKPSDAQIAFHLARFVDEGDAPWRPLRVFDDGAKVYIQFPSGLAQSEAPPLFVAGPDAKPALMRVR